MGIRLQALTKFLQSDRMLIRGAARKVRREGREASKEQKLFNKLNEAIKLKRKDVIKKCLDDFSKEAKKELDLLDDAITNVLVEKKRNVNRIYAAIPHAKTDASKKAFQADLNLIRDQLLRWFKILQGNSQGGRLQAISMDNVVLNVESIRVAKVAARRVGKLKSDESKASKAPTEKALSDLRKDLDDVIKLENQLFADLEQLTLQESGLELTELNKIISSVPALPESLQKHIADSKAEINTKLKSILKSQIDEVNTLIRISQ